MNIIKFLISNYKFLIFKLRASVILTRYCITGVWAEKPPDSSSSRSLVILTKKGQCLVVFQPAIIWPRQEESERSRGFQGF